MVTIDNKTYTKEKFKRIILSKKIQSYLVQLLIKLGISTNYILPFILTTIIALNINEKTKNNFVIEDPSIPTSFTYDESKLEEGCFIYSTGWIQNLETCRLERTEITFRKNENIDLADAQAIIDMSPEELKDSFVIENIRTVNTIKDKRDNYIYRDDTIIIPGVHIDGEEKLVRSPMHKEVLSRNLMFLAIAFISGFTLKKFEDLVTHSYIRNKLKENLEDYQSISKQNIEYLNEQYMYFLKHSRNQSPKKKNHIISKKYQ